VSAASPAEPPAPARSRARGWLIGLLRTAAGLFVLFLVARTLPWRDQLVFDVGAEKSERTLALAGSIDGDWTAESVGFRLDPGQEIAAAWPAAVRDAARDGSVLVVERRPRSTELGGAYDWRPSMPRAFRDLNPGWVGLAFAFFVLAMSCAVTRWWRLLAVVGCRTSWWNAWRLTFLGMFFNLVVPGLTGGDLVKSVIVAHENPGRRGEAVVSVVVDRLIGLVSLAALALAVILLSGQAFAELRLPVVAFLGAAILGALVYVNGTLRRLVRFDALMARLPLGGKLRALDEAVLTYRKRPREIALAVGISLANHSLTTAGFLALGSAFSVTGASVAEYFVMVPIGNIVSALPLAPGGWGLGEAAFRVLFEMSGASGLLGVAVSVTFRLCQLSFGLVGGVFLLMPKSRAELHQAR
jgi:uncharacterized protein (TIRG00374 family)